MNVDLNFTSFYFHSLFCEEMLKRRETAEGTTIKGRGGKGHRVVHKMTNLTSNSGTLTVYTKLLSDTTQNSNVSIVL